jgi:hypothetical protein
VRRIRNDPYSDHENATNDKEACARPWPKEISEHRTAAELAARHHATQAALDRVHDAITRVCREKTPVTVAAVARRALLSELKRKFPHVNG